MTCDKKKAGGVRSPQNDAENDCETCSLNAECYVASTSTKAQQVSRDTTALSILEAGANHTRDRAKFYDRPMATGEASPGERSMAPTVAAFNTITGHQLSEEQGWLFMELLKCVRAEHNGYRPDNYEDGAAYVALKGEAAARNRGESST